MKWKPEAPFPIPNGGVSYMPSSSKFIQVHFHSQLEKLFMFPKFNYHFFCCWFGTFFYFSHHIVNFMIPADELNWCTA